MYSISALLDKVFKDFEMFTRGCSGTYSLIQCLKNKSFWSLRDTQTLF